MKLDTASLKPRICAICKCDLAEIASSNDCEYCVLYQTVHFCPGKRLSKRALTLTFASSQREIPKISLYEL